MQNVTVVGLGKLGTPIAAVYHSVGHRVRGIDLSPAIVDSVNSRQPPFLEPGLAEALRAGPIPIQASCSWETALEDADLSIVIVPTPSDSSGSFTNRHVIEAVESIGHGIASGLTHSPHTVIVASTVMPGSMDGPIRSALESSARQPLGRDLGLVYSPQFIALGSVLHNLRHPDMVLIGASDDRAAKHAQALLESAVESDASFQAMSLVNAEIVKLAVNTFVTTKISFANMLSEICAVIDNADVDVVTRAVGADSRIGTKYLSAGLGYGGPCFPRDNIALSAFARSRGTEATLAEATDRVNDRQVDRIAAAISTLGDEISTIAIWGLAYKPGTDVTDASQGLQIAAALLGNGYDVMVHDPLVTPERIAMPRSSWLDDLRDSARADVIVIASPCAEYEDATRHIFPGIAFIDPWNLVRDDVPCRVIRPGRQEINRIEVST